MTVVGGDDGDHLATRERGVLRALMRIATPFGAHSSRAAPSAETRPHLRRNFTLGVISGVAYNLYLATLSTQLVMTWFLSELTDSNLLISLLLPIEIGSWYFLQLVLLGYVQRRARALPMYQAMAAIRVAAMALLSLATFVLDRPTPLTVAFMSTFAISSVAAGISALPFLQVVMKTIPPRKRGMYFGWRRFAGGLLGLAGAALVRAVLAPDFALAFPDNYGLLFAAGCLITLVMVGTFSLVLEPAEQGDPGGSATTQPLGDGLRQALRDGNYRRYLGLRVALAVASYSLPFYAVYARRTLQATGDRLGTYLMGATLAGVLSNLLLGGMGDRRGNRLLVRVAAVTAVLPPAAALSLAHVGETALDPGVLFTLVFVLQGLHETAHSIGSNNYLLELGGSKERVTYVSLAHGAVGLAILGSPLGGAMVDRMGLESLFTLSLVGGLVALVLSLGLGEPRMDGQRGG
jgi:MFS family permease